MIEKKIDLFETNKLDLFDLVNDLSGLLNALESVPDDWRKDFHNKINILEMIHDSIEDGSISKWKGNFKQDIHKSISKLKNMAASIIEKYLKIWDPNIIESAIAASSNWLICPNCNDAWESNSSNAMVICPKCERAFRNPLAPISQSS